MYQYYKTTSGVVLFWLRNISTTDFASNMFIRSCFHSPFYASFKPSVCLYSYLNRKFEFWPQYGTAPWPGICYCSYNGSSTNNTRERSPISQGYPKLLRHFTLAKRQALGYVNKLVYKILHHKQNTGNHSQEIITIRVCKYIKL